MSVSGLIAGPVLSTPDSLPTEFQRARDAAPAAPSRRKSHSVRPQRNAARPQEYRVPTGAERDVLYASFRPLVQRLIRQYGEDVEARQDLEGEIYCRFCALLEGFDPERGIPLRPYLVRMLTASVYTYTRAQWRRRDRETLIEAEHSEALVGDDPSGEWDRKLAAEEVLRSLPDAIRELPLRQRQVVIWRYYESRSFEEIAELLNIRLATARSLLRHGLNNLRRRLT